MAIFRFTANGDYTPSNSTQIFNSLINANVRTFDFGPGSSIPGYTDYEDEFVSVLSGPGFPTQFTRARETTSTAGIYGDASDFGYTATITGGDYGDVFRTGAGDDILKGGGGDDMLEGGRGSNTIDGGAGNNTLSYEHFDAAFESLPGTFIGVSVAMAFGSIGSTEDYTGFRLVDNFTNISNIRGSAYTDYITGDDKNNVIEGGADNDTLSGGDGRDTLSYEHSSDGVQINLFDDTAFGGDAAGDQIAAFENLLGSTSGDELYGDAYDNVIEGGAGGDLMSGGTGNDTLSYRQSSDGVAVDLFTNAAGGGDAQGDSFSDFENVIGSTAADDLLGNDDANTLNGNGGGDTLAGRGGDDRLVISETPSIVDGGDETDLLFVNPGSFVELTSATFQNIERVYVRDGAALDMSGVDTGARIYSQSVTQNDTSIRSSLIIGTAGNDVMKGGKGNDILIGGKGGDSLFAGAGADSFVFTDGDGRDVIRKFDGLVDTLDVTALATSIDDMNFTSYRGGTATVITFDAASSPKDKIILLDVAFDSLDAGHFVF